MTKYLVKIISICAFVVLIPVIIAGVALSAIGSTMFTLSAYVAGASTTNTSASYSISIGEVDKDKEGSTSASFLNGTDVNVSVDLKGYDFLGWYKGDDKTYDATSEPLSHSTSYTFTLTGNTQVTARVGIKKFNLRFQGSYLNGTPVDLSDRNGVYEYGADLPVLSSTEGTFGGWFVVSAPEQSEGTTLPQTSFTTASFDDLKSSTSAEDTYVLEPAWSERVRVAYYTTVDGEVKEISSLTKSYSIEGIKNFTFVDENDEKVLEAIGKGYSFGGWVDAAGATITEEDIRSREFNSSEVIAIYIKKNVIEYSIRVKKFEDSTGKDVAVMTYKANVEENGGFSTLSLTRQYYTFTGITLDEDLDKTEYTLGSDYEGLSAIILNAYPHEAATIDATAIWECHYPALNITYGARHVAQDGGLYPVFVKTSAGKYERLVKDNELGGGDPIKRYVVSDKAVEGNKDPLIKLEDSIYETMLSGATGPFYVKPLDGEPYEVKLTAIRVYNSLTSIGYSEITKDITTVGFARIITALESYMDTDIRIEFRFEPVNA